ncbi:OmpH family outer membrane protein [Fusibacter bizertensis]|nr:OmpH family outer membrane protein [Fusibacter bizertensis]
MMRMLSSVQFIWVFSILTFTLVLLILNLRLFIRRGRTPVTFIVHALSIFTVLFLSTILMRHVSFDMTFFPHYKLLGDLFLAMIIALLLGFIYVYFQTKAFHLPPDLHEVFTQLEDLILVYDYSGKLHLNNHPDLCNRYFINLVPTLDELRHNGKNPYEWELEGKDKTYTLWTVITPIFSNLEPIGTAVVFYDVSVEKALYQEIEQKNKEIEVHNEKLRSNLYVYAQYEAEKMRLEVISELQENLIHRLESVILRIQRLESVATSDTISDIADELRDVYQLVRQSVQDIANRKGGYDYD